MIHSARYTTVLRQLADTEQFARGLAVAVQELPPFPTTIALVGSLGSGKTQWSRYFCSGLDVPETAVTSPTYVLLQRYAGKRTIHHLDLYRLRSEAEVWDLGVDELLERPDVVLIEWADRFPACLPDERLEIHFEHAEDERRAQVTATGVRPHQLLEHLVHATQARLSWHKLTS